MSRTAFFLLSQCQRPNPSDRGLTLIEVLLAIVMVGVILAAIAPVLALSVATRVQSRKVEQATALAQQEIDRVRATMARSLQAATASGELQQLPPPTDNFGDLAAPEALSSDIPGSEGSPTTAGRVDIDNDGEDDFFVQIFRDNGRTRDGGTCASADISGGCLPELVVFRMRVRVYDATAESKLDSWESSRDADGDCEPDFALSPTQTLGKWQTYPIAIASAEISRSDEELSLAAYWEYLDSAPSTGTCP